MYQEITLQLATHCTLHCPYCFADTNEKKIISEADFEYFENFCKRNQPDCIHITGGEPTVHPNFADIVNRLSNIAPLVIYSNLTVQNSLDEINAMNPKDIVFLGNFNKRNFYTQSQWETFEKNIAIIKRKKMRLAIGHTFFQEPFLSDLEKVIFFIRENGLDHFRMSQAMAGSDGSLGLEKKQIRKLYSIVADRIEKWKEWGIKAYFDCPVPACYIEKQTFDKLRAFNAISIRCIPKAFVLWDLSVTHCYTMINPEKKLYLHDFHTIQDVVSNSELLLRTTHEKKDRRKCMNCVNSSTYICGCPNYHSE